MPIIKMIYMVQSNNNNKALVQKFWGQLWILNKLVRVDQMSFFTTNNVISYLPLPFSVPLI